MREGRLISSIKRGWRLSPLAKIKHRPRTRSAKWQNIFYLPFDPVWHNAMFLSSYVCIILHLYYSIEARCLIKVKHLEGMFYFLDAVYMLDAILALICKCIPRTKSPDYYVSTRSICIIFLDVLSAVPWELLFSSNTTEKKKIFCLLRLNRCLRIVRIIYFYRKQLDTINRKMNVLIAELCFLVVFVSLLTYCAFCNTSCFQLGCRVDHICYSSRSFTSIISKSATSGWADFSDVTLSWEIYTSLAVLVVSLFIFGTAFAYLTIDTIHSFSHRTIYEDKYRIAFVRIQTSSYEKSAHFNNYVSEIFYLIWEHRKGYVKDTSFLKLLPSALCNDILTDMSWSAFKHSQLFRSADLPVLRYISLLMKQEVFLPGEYLFRKNEWKDKMFYVLSGTIELLSEEDGETPVLLFTQGTCIGESCLIRSYKSINSVRSKSVTEVHVLEKKQFIHVLAKFPNQCKKFLELIANRYKEARELKHLSDLARGVNKRPVDIYTTFWLKNTLHKLMALAQAQDDELIYRHELQNIYFQSDISEQRLENLVFTAKYLDMLAIKERIAADTDTVFVKTTCPCILQPTSIIRVLWEILILLITIFLLFLIPYVSFISDEPPNWYNVCVYIATYIFWFDIYVQISTAVKTDYRIFTKVRKILSFRLKTFSFWADMFSCIPFEIFSCIVLSEVDKNNAVMHLNRLLKIWRIGRVFNLWEKKFLVNIILVCYLKFLLIILYASFLLCCKMYKIKQGSFLELITVSVQIITGVGVFDAGYIPDRLEFIVADISSRFIALLMYRSIAAAAALAYVNKLKVHELCCDMADKCKFKVLSPSQTQIMTDQFRFHWSDNKCAILKYGRTLMQALNNNVKLELRDFMTGEALRSHNFFKFFSNNVIIDIYDRATAFAFPQNEIMFHQGDFSNCFIVIAQGQVDQLSFNGVSFQKRPYEWPIILNVMESCLGLPCLVTSVAATDCKVIFLAFDTFVNILIKYPDQLKMLKELVGACSDLKQNGLEISGTIDENSVYTSTKVPKKSWHYFGFNMKPDSFVEYDYYIPFDHLYPFGFVQYFLGRCMILPDAKILFAWETSRCVFAIFSCILCFVIPVVNHVTYKYVLYVIDATAFLDIYFRLQICYYDERGILITHPLRTAGHYFTHGFLIDFIGALPLYWIISTEDYSLYFMLNLNRFLQLHRLFQMFRFLRTDSMSYIYKIYSIIYIPFLLVLANYWGSLLISTECKFSLKNKDFGKEIQCKSDSILFLSDFSKPIGELRAHFFGVYIAISILTNIGMQGFQYTSELTKVFFSVLSVLGLFFSVTAMAIILTIYFSERNTRGSYYQRAMKDLIKFMDISGVSPALKNAIINNFELKWKHLKGRSIKALTKPFFETLAKDVLYGCFGNDLYNSCVFVKKTERLCRNLLPLMTHDVVSKGGYLQTINDVSEQMVFLLKGTADVLAADGIKIATLYNGSIFGNLKNVKKSRLLVSVVANCHVEILWIDSTMFYKVLQNFPEVEEEFLQFRATYLNYIPSTTEEEPVINQAEETGVHQYVEEPCGRLYVCSPNSKKMRIFIAISTFVVYLQMLFELYKIGMFDFSLTLTAIVYVFDILYWISFIVKGFVAYEDDVGNLITDVNVVRKHNRGKKLLWLEIACLVPLDVVIYVLPLSNSLRNYLLCLMRLNRLLRIIFIFQYFSNSFKKLNVNYVLLGFQHLIVWISLVITGMACIINWISCLLPVNMDPHIPSCREFLYMTSQDKFNLFIRYLYIITDFLTLTSQHIYYPQGTLSVILFMIIMIICHHLYIIALCQIFRILNGSSQRIYKYFRLLTHLDLFMQKGYVSPALFTKVWNYLQMFWIRKKGVTRPKLLYEAPIYLMDAIMNDAFSYLLSNNSVFEKCHPDCLRQIVQKLSSRDYYPGDFIDYKGSVNDSMYFIFTGEVQVLQDEYLFKNNIITVLKAGDSFGVLQGLYGIPHEYSFKSNENSNVLTLSRNTWEYLLDFFPASKESIYSVAAEYNGF